MEDQAARDAYVLAAQALDRAGQLARPQEEAQRAQLGMAPRERGPQQPPAEGREELPDPLVTHAEAAVEPGEQLFDRHGAGGGEPDVHHGDVECGAVVRHQPCPRVSLQPRASARGNRPRTSKRLPGQLPSSTPRTTPMSSVSST